MISRESDLVFADVRITALKKMAVGISYLEVNKVIGNLKMAFIHVKPPAVRTALYFISLVC